MVENEPRQNQSGSSVTVMMMNRGNYSRSGQYEAVGRGVSDQNQPGLNNTSEEYIRRTHGMLLLWRSGSQ